MLRANAQEPVPVTPRLGAVDVIPSGNAEDLSPVGCGPALAAAAAGGSPTGAEKIALRWAEIRKVPQVAVRPDWTKHAKAAPFKRNDAMLAIMPIGVIVFPSTGIQDNLADKARKLGIPVYRFGSGGA